MKTLALTFLICVPALLHAQEEEKSPDSTEASHREASNKVADKQDDLSADVDQLAMEQTAPEVIKLLNEVEKIMDEATDQLSEADTGGKTIAAQTEVIEKIHAAAKEKQKQGGSGESGSAMMDMMERMMGEGKDGDQPGKEKGKKPGDTGGQGMTGDSDAANTADHGVTGGKSEVRKIPKAAGVAGKAMPEEFQKALDAYNRGAEKKVR